MSTISGPSSNALPAGNYLPPLAAPALGTGPKAAREFEAQLIGTVLESLEKTFATLPGQDTMAGQDDYNYMGTEALASALAAGGGFGIAKMITQHLEASQAAHQGLTQTK
jgi:Rod binding domain-containing protein